MSYPNQSNYQQQVFSFISSVLGQKNIIPVPVEFVRFTGDANTAMLLTQIIYWSDRTKDPDHWFYKSYVEWEEELALSKYQVNRSAGVLKSMDLIETKVKKIFNGETVLHYRLNTITFIDKFGEYLNNRKALQTSTSEVPSLPEVKKLDSLKSINFTPTPLLYTETTILKTTTTKPPTNVTSKMKIKPPENKGLLLLPLEKDVEKLMNLIPNQNLSEELTPQLKNIISKALNSGHTVDSIALAIQYTTDKSKGSPFEFKSYLGKTLLNNYHAGYVSKQEAIRINQEKVRQIEQDKRDAEILKNLKERSEREKMRLKDEFRTKALNDLKSLNPTHYQEIQLQALEELKAINNRKYDVEGAFVRSKMITILGL